MSLLLAPREGFSCVESFALRLDCEGQSTVAITDSKPEIKVCQVRSCRPSN